MTLFFCVNLSISQSLFNLKNHLITVFVFTDMDVAECERKRFEFIDDLTDLEKQFAILREQ